MNDKFLGALASYYFQNYETAISDFCFVFPSRRAGVFFSKHLSSLSNKPFFSPKIFTINEFFEELGSSKVTDPVILLFKLYEVYRHIHPQALTFDEFMPWGEMLLSDFDDIDKYLVDPNQLFSNLVSYKQIESDYSFLSEEQVKAIQSFWNTFDPNKLSQHQISFLQNWEILFPLYQAFQKRLEEEGITYSGMQMRKLVHKIHTGKELNLAYKKVIFAGFFVLTPAEKAIFRFFKERKVGEFFWDYSEQLMRDMINENGLSPVHLPFHDPGYFMRENLAAFPSPPHWQLPMNKQQPEITISGVASQTEQLRILSAFLGELQPDSPVLTDQKELNTAIILTDENLLIPTLHAIPPSFGKINVTLGYPLKNTPIYSLIEFVFQLQKNSKITSQGKVWFYFRDVLPILQHPYIAGFEPELTQQIKKNMLSKNSIFIEAHELCQSEFLSHLFKKIVHTGEFASYMSSLLFRTYQLIKKSERTFFEQEFVYSLYKEIVRLDGLLQKIEMNIEPSIWLKLFKRLTEKLTVPFKGEPLSGLQVMGILETRTLDFDHLFILNMNEGVFPKDSAPISFIPYNLRKGFGLPTLEHQDAIFSYYFFRLIHRSKKVHLTFSSASDGMKSGEMSRFLYQLIYEHPSQPILKTAVEPVRIKKLPEIITLKSAQVMNVLNQYRMPNHKILSPSALSTYLECPLKFSYRYIHSIKEPEEITEDLDPRVFGILFHHCMEVLYQPFVNKEVSEKEFVQLLRNKQLIEKTLIDAFNIHFSELSLNHQDVKELQGKNQLVFEVLLKYIRKFIENDAKQAPIHVLGLEAKIEGKIEVNQSLVVNVGGIIDRYDRIDHQIRVMDYKTGGGKDSVADLAHLFNPEKHSDYKAIFQTLLYCHILSQNHPTYQHIQPCVVWLTSVFNKSDYSLSTGSFSNKKTIVLKAVENEYLDYLMQLLTEIFDANTPFTQTTKAEKCRNCTYQKLCNKYQ